MEHKYYTEEQILEALSEVGVGAGDTSEVLSYLGRLPSAEPEITLESASDLIDRQKAIMDAESWVAIDDYEKYLQKNVVEWLKEFPPAELGTNLAEVSTDTISRQAAIDVLHGYFDGMLDTDTVCPADIYGLFECIPSAQPEQHWIPCSERYPEENQICIVTDETMRNTYEYRFCKETYDENQGWTYLKHRIIAWMPLPTPYQEDSK